MKCCSAVMEQTHQRDRVHDIYSHRLKDNIILFDGAIGDDVAN